ncbi:MAG: tetratricopeptide repeat protein [Oligoflexus sp.]
MLILRTLMIILLLLAGPRPASAQYEPEQTVQTLPALIDLNYSNQLPYLIEYSFVLKHRAKYFPISLQEADQAWTKAMTKTRQNMDRADRISTQELSENYQQLYDLYQFYGKVPWNIQVEAKIQDMRPLIYKLGEWVYLKENDETKRKAIRASYLPLGLGQSQLHQNAISELIKFKDQAPEIYQASFKLLVYYQLSSAETTLAAAQKSLTDNPTKFASYESTLIQLIQSRLQAGIYGQHWNGKADNNVYDTLLGLSQSVKNSRYEGIRHRIEATILDTWVMITPNVDWRKVPIVEVMQRDHDLSPGLRERIVLEYIPEGQLQYALDFYRVIAKQFVGQKNLPDIDQRRLELTKTFAEQKQQYEILNQLYVELLKKYSHSESQLDAKLKKAFFHYLFRDFEGTVKDLLKNSQPEMTTTISNQAALNFAKNFLQYFSKQRTAVVSVKEELASFYEDKMQQPAEAAQIYIDLAKEATDKYLAPAISSQMKAARWNSRPVWTQIKQEYIKERQLLLQLLEQYSDHSQKKKLAVDWHLLAHQGLLYRHLGDADQASKIWRSKLEQAKTGDDSHGAFGILLAESFQSQNWQQIIEVYEIAEKASIAPSYNEQPMNSVAMYQQALLKRGQAYQEAKNFEAALIDFETFAARFKNDKRRPIALYFTAVLHRQLKQLQRSFAAVKTMMQDSPELPLTKRAMLEAAQWAQASGGSDLKHAAFFYQRYIEDFSSDARMPAARFQLAHVLAAMEMGSESAQLFRRHSQDARMNKQERVRAALNYIQLEAQTGNLGQALAESEPILRIADASQKNDYVSAHVILAKIVTEKQQAQAMAEEEKILLPYAKNRKDVAEAVGMLRFYRAESLDLEVPFIASIVPVIQYRSTIEGIYRKYHEISKIYDIVCQPAENSFCHQAYARNKQLAQDAMDSIGSLMIDSQADPKQVSHLQELQKAHIEKLKEFFTYYHNMAEKFERYEAPEVTAGIVAAH